MTDHSPAFNTDQDAEPVARPFVDDLLSRSRSDFNSYHMPGHKHRAPTGSPLTDFWGEAIYSSDLSEMGGLDYLHAPEGALLEAQRLAALTFGAGETFFLINGSTVGNQAALLATVPPGKKVLLPRASHRSVYAALMLADADPVYLASTTQPGSALPAPATPEQIGEALDRNSEIVAIHLTSPDYYGNCLDLPAICLLAREHQIPVIVDEAHGSHFGLAPGYPISAMQAGADISIQSTHKWLGALTQSSMLHVRPGSPYIRRLRQALAMLQSSSPSALLLASLDDARASIDASGATLLAQTLALTERVRERVAAIPGLQTTPVRVDPAHGSPISDPAKVLIRVHDLGISGFDAAAWLQRVRGIEVELKDLDHILCTLTVADTDASIDALIDALTEMSHLHGAVTREVGADSISQPPWPAIPERIVSLREAFHSESDSVSAEAAVGGVSAEFVIPYPPGIPILLPGERVTAEAIAYAQALITRGGRIVGPDDNHLTHLRVQIA